MVNTCDNCGCVINECECLNNEAQPVAESLTVVKKCKKCGYKPRHGEVLPTKTYNDWECPKCKTVNKVEYENREDKSKKSKANV